MMQIKRGSSLVFMMLLVAILPVEAREERTGAFVGLSWGQTNFETSSSTIDPSDCGAGIPCNISESSDMWKVFGGYRFNDWIAVESDLRSFGEAKGNLTDRTFEIEGRAWDFYLRGGVPIGPVDLFAKLGFAWVDGEYSQVCSSGCVSGTVDFNKTTWAGGLGIMGNIGKIGLRLEWEPYNNSGFSRTDVFSIGIQYRFGR